MIENNEGKIVRKESGKVKAGEGVYVGFDYSELEKRVVYEEGNREESKVNAITTAISGKGKNHRYGDKKE